MVRLSEVYNNNWYVDTRDARLTMYKALNWIPPELLGIKESCSMPTVVYYEGKIYVLKDEYCINKHYEVADGNAK